MTKRRFKEERDVLNINGKGYNRSLLIESNAAKTNEVKKENKENDTDALWLGSKEMKEEVKEDNDDETRNEELNGDNIDEISTIQTFVKYVKKKAVQTQSYLNY
jgi:hypothetical protein